jgi:hypothetical protein
MKSTLSRVACIDGNFSCYNFAISFYRFYLAPAEVLPCFKGYACRRHCVDDRLYSAVRLLYYAANLIKCRRSVVCKASCFWLCSGGFFHVMATSFISQNSLTALMQFPRVAGLISPFSTFPFAPAQTEGYLQTPSLGPSCPFRRRLWRALLSDLAAQ